jgi:hypothetical protein
VREYYKQHYPITEDARNGNRLNPGDGWVSCICHEPRVALTILEDMLAPYVSNGKVVIYTEMKPVHAETDGDFVKRVTVRNTVTGKETNLVGHYFLDATDVETSYLFDHTRTRNRLNPNRNLSKINRRSSTKKHNLQEREIL